MSQQLKQNSPAVVSAQTQHLAWLDAIKKEKIIKKKREFSDEKIHLPDQVAITLNKYDNQNPFELILQSNINTDYINNGQRRNSQINLNRQNNTLKPRELRTDSLIKIENQLQNNQRSHNQKLSQDQSNSVKQKQYYNKIRPSNELTMDLAIQGSRNQKAINLESLAKPSYQFKADLSKSFDQSTMSKFKQKSRYLPGLSLKVFHNNDDMQWTQSKLYKKFFINNLKYLNQTLDANSLNYYEDQPEDPAKIFSHNTMIKRKQLQNQSQIFIDKYKNNLQKYADMKNNKNQIEAISLDNPFVFMKELENHQDLSLNYSPDYNIKNKRSKAIKITYKINNSNQDFIPDITNQYSNPNIITLQPLSKKQEFMINKRASLNINHLHSSLDDQLPQKMDLFKHLQHQYFGYQFYKQKNQIFSLLNFSNLYINFYQKALQIKPVKDAKTIKQLR